jgi:vancomycin resistance protein VanJ
MTQPGDAAPNSPPTATSRDHRRGRVLTIVCWAYLVAVLGVWLVLQWADQWWPATIVMFSPRWLVGLPLAILLPVAAFRRSRSVVVLLIAAVIVGGPVSGFNIPWQRLAHSEPTGAPLRVMTLNMHYSKVDPKTLEELIATHELDVVAIQEWQDSDRSALHTAPGWHIHSTLRLFLASRHPIRRATELGHDSMGEHASATHYELDTPAGPVHVFSLHTATNRQGISDTIHENRKGPAEVQANSARRREQSVYLAGQAATCRGPVVVLGDFNTPPESPIFQQVWVGYTDAFSAAGWGWGYTFYGSHTAVRIDHVLAGAGWRVNRCRVGPDVGSPHRPVIAELTLVER